MRDRYIESNGIRLHYREHPGEGPTLVLTHGLTANACFFDALVAAGLTPGLTVLAVDLRGRGLSDKPDTGYTMDDHATDLLGILDELGIERAYLGGHSFGGLLTYYLAANHADRVARCVVLDAPAEIDPRIREQIEPSLARLGQTAPSFEAYLATVRALPYFNGWWDEHCEGYYRADVEELPDGSVKPRAHPDHIRQAVEGSAKVDWPSTVSRIEQPTLLVRATAPYGPPGYPAIVTRDQARRTLELLGNGSLVELDGNHLTAFFGNGAVVAAGAIRDFILEDR